MRRFGDIDLVRNELKLHMPLQHLIELADVEYYEKSGKQPNQITKVNDRLYKKKCDMDVHPVDSDGSVDSTPSFTICPQKELWHCFGCGAHGDRFEYVSQRFNMSHMEAIEKVAEIEQFDLTPYYVEMTVEEQMIIGLFKSNDEARDMAYNELISNDKALEYLHGRGITDESIEMFQLGYAPPVGDGSIFNNIDNKDALQLNRKDQFNDSILFPINDSMGRMRYFQARPFVSPSGMKYIGSNDSHPLFSREERMFGFDIAKRNLIRNGGKLVGVEGAPDAIACVQHGINAVGILGTAINQETFNLLSKYRVHTLVLLLDGDKAGKDKAIKDSEKYLGIDTDVHLKVAVVPEDGLDPEEYINKNGADGLIETINDAPYAVQYLIDSKWNNATTPTAKMEYIYSIQPYMDAIDNQVLKKIMVNHIAGKVGLDPVQIEDYYLQSALKQTGGSLYAPDEEELLLAEALRRQDFIPELTMRFHDDDWYLLKHRMLFKVLKKAQYNDIDSIFTTIKNMNIDNIVTYSWLEQLYKKTGNVEFGLNDVEDKLIRRRSLNIVDGLKIQLNNLQTDTSVVIDKATTDMYNAMHNKSDEKIYDAVDQVDEIMAEIQDRMNNPVDIIGYSFGGNFAILDKYTLGLQPKTLTIVAANQSVGKTQLCQNFAMWQAVELNIPILWFSLEMDKKKMTYRNLAILSGLNAKDIMTGNITREQKIQLDMQAIRLRQSQYNISERGHDLSESIAIAKRYVRSGNARIIYVDYAQLQYVTDRRTETRSRELGVISKEWKKFSQDMEVPVVLISQLGRQALDADTAEAEHGYGSYEVAQDADNYITIKDKTNEEIQAGGIEHGNKTINISKNRMGEKSVLIDSYSEGYNYRMIECAERS